MSDFLRWLYANYIRPQLDKAPPEEYEMSLSQLENGLPPYLRGDYEQAREFTALQAFLLGLRTGQGLPRP